MQDAHYHLLFNHIPIIVPFIGLVILIGGIVLKSALIQRVAFFIFIIGSIGTLPAFFTGEGAEEVVENFQDITKRIIHEHEEKAETFAILSYILGIISLIALWANWKKKSFSNLLAYLIIILCLFVLYFAQLTGNSGGEIRHTEIRSSFGTVQNAGLQENKVDED
ncbi:MAG TPA: hypothetical protein PLU17_05660 [Chitinophagaceae bacterium]|nr:hypothetical protein [Chitinophagaceae bacterium]